LGSIIKIPLKFYLNKMMYIFHYERCTSFGVNDVHLLGIETAIQ